VKRLKIIFFLLAVFIPFIIYILTTSHSIYGVDSGDFLAASWVWGVAHSPGYPLYTIFLALWARIPFGLDPIFQMNLSSAVFHSLTVGFVFLILRKLTKSYFLSLVACYVLAFSYLFWTYSLVVEAFALNDLFASILILIAIYFWEAVKAKKHKLAEKLLLLFTLTFSLSLAHHQTIILFLPGFLYLFFKSGFQKKLSYLLFVKLLFAAFIGLLPYLYLPIAASFNPPINWGDPDSLGRFFAVLTRQDWGSFRSSATAPQHIGFNRYIQVVWYIDFLKTDFLYLGLIIGIIGALRLFFKQHIMFWFFILNLLISGPLFLFYANFSTDAPFILEVIQRFVLLSYMSFVVFLAFGLLVIRSILNKFLSIFIHSKNLLHVTCYLLLVTAALSYLLFIFFANYQKTDLSKINLGSNLAYDTLITEKKPATLSLEDDTVYFNSIALNTIEKVNLQIQLVMGGQMNKPFYIDTLKKYYPQFNFPPELEKEPYFYTFLDANIQKSSIYTIQGTSSAENGSWLPMGILSKFCPKGKEPSDEEFDNLQEEMWTGYKNNIEEFSKTNGNLTFEHIKGLYTAAHNRVAVEYLRRNNSKKAKKHILEAINIYPSFSYSHYLLGNILNDEGDCGGSISEYQKAYDFDKRYIASFLDNALVAQNCLGDQKLSEDYLQEYNRLVRETQNSI